MFAGASIPTISYADAAAKQFGDDGIEVGERPLWVEAAERVVRAQVDDDEGGFAAEGPVGMGPPAGKPPRANVTAGAWWPAGFAGPPAISLDEEMAHELGLGPGDTLTVNILGREMTAQIRNLRRIDWQDFGINFFVIFAPGTLEAAPQTHLATATIEEFGEDAVYKDVTDCFSNISVIRVREVIDTAARLLDRIGVAGAGADVLRAYVLEFALLGVLTAILAGLAGSLAAYLVVAQVMHGE